LQVWKFPLLSESKILRNEKQDAIQVMLDMPEGAKILSLQVQNDMPCIWALVDPSAENVKRTFVIIGTGITLPKGEFDFVGTFQLEKLGLVFHVFES
jgi:hypothetical protein